MKDDKQIEISTEKSLLRNYLVFGTAQEVSNPNKVKAFR